MPVSVLSLVLFFFMAGHSSATYCICKDGVGDSLLQKDIDYACGSGADCSPILENAPCFNPNTVKDHCNYAVNSYFQRKGQATGSCDFAGTATISQTLPSSQSSACVYPSSSSNLGTSPPSNNPVTPPTITVPSTNTPTITPPGSTTTNPGSTTGTPGSTTGVPGSTTPIFGIGPAGSGSITSTNNNYAVTLHRRPNSLNSFIRALLLSGLMFLRT